MKIRIYYNPNNVDNWEGRVAGIVVINDEDWNLAELINDSNCKFATFELTEKNLDKYMVGPDVVNLETIKEVEGLF
jgi:hypothetical protein